MILENKRNVKNKPLNVLNYEDAKVVLNGGYEKPDYNFYIKDTGVFTKGNFSVITGKAKSRKSTLLSMFLGAFLTDRIILKWFESAGNGKLILFDTEQSKFHIHRLVKYACLLSNNELHPENFQVYALRPFNPVERCEIINEILEKEKNINYVVIDGIRDLVHDFNSAEEATEISTKLMKWTAEYNCHITNVLHQNKGDNNARGHLGTELVNKAETVLSVEKLENVSKVECAQSRGMPFDGFQFGINISNKLFIEPYIGKDDF